jgi:hypothetical protein
MWQNILLLAPVRTLTVSGKKKKRAERIILTDEDINKNQNKTYFL